MEDALPELPRPESREDIPNLEAFPDPVVRASSMVALDGALSSSNNASEKYCLGDVSKFVSAYIACLSYHLRLMIGDPFGCQQHNGDPLCSATTRVAMSGRKRELSL